MRILKALSILIAGTVIAGIAAALALAPAVGVGGVAVARTDNTMKSNLADLRDGAAPGISTITDANGTPMAWLYKQQRYEVQPDQISQAMKDAIVSIEDRRFYEHEGVDLQGTARAMVTNILSGGVAQGASTLNQQYVKNYLLLVNAKDEQQQAAAIETSIPRKLREMRMASDLDKLLSKDEVLTRYLNVVPFGNNVYGVEAAARAYFDVSAAELSIPQAAMLAGMVQSSSYFDPYTNPDATIERRNTVLDTMVSTNTLSAEDAESFKNEPLGVLEEPNVLPNGCIAAGDRGFMCDYVLNYLDSKGLSVEDITQGSYTITTTLDPEVQDAAHAAVTSHVDPKAPGVAEVLNVIAPGTDSRDVLAMTSSRDYGLDAENMETMYPQPSMTVGNGAGSIFKIFTAAAALEQGVGLDSMLDVPSRYEAEGLGSGGAANCPANFYCVENAGQYKSRLSLRDALAQSPNTTFVQLIEQVGVSSAVDMAVKLGLRSYAEAPSEDEPSLADSTKEHNLGSFTLGPDSVSSLELTNVGATIASDGRWCEPNPVKSVIDNEGKEVHIDRPDCEDALDPEVAHALANGLSSDAVNGTAADAAKSASWSEPISAKTGTTESHQSAAFLGFNSAFASSVYIFNDGTTHSPLCTSPVRQCDEGSLYGGNEPAQTWFQLAQDTPRAHQGNVPDYDHSFDRGRSQSFLDSLAGMSQEDARRQLTDHGYTATTRRVSGSTVPRNYVARAVTSDGGQLRPGGEVVLEISDGNTPQTRSNNSNSNESNRPSIEVPSITTNDLDELANELRQRLGL